MTQIIFGDLVVDVVLKNIKNLHLSVYPPDGKVKVAAPERMDIDSIRIYVISKLEWIRKQQIKFISQDREDIRDFVNRESHYYLGKRYLLNIIESDNPLKVEIKYKTINLYIRPNTDRDRKCELLDEWYREQLRSLVKALILKWEKRIGVDVQEFFIKKMKTKWGSCNIDAKRIWINLELAKKNIECIEYIVVHEMVHLLERNHNNNFIAYMNRFLPEWKVIKDTLNKAPISHREWEY
ncbi:M48 family metallopeptidase [Dysgonomonas sp.]